MNYLKIFVISLIFIGIAVFSFLLGSANGKEKTTKISSTLCSNIVASTPCINKKTDDIEILAEFINPEETKKKFVESTTITQILKGELVDFTDNEWTIKKGDAVYTIDGKQNISKPLYFIQTGKNKFIETTKENLKKGNIVEIFLSAIPPEWKANVLWIRIYK